MNAAQFNEILDEQLDTCRQILGSKAEEYATETDRLHNFKVAAVIRSSTQAQALAGMMVKHTTSVYDMINSGEEYPASLWVEKITDHMNYLILLKAVVLEENQTRKDATSS